jgi:hypothetical protein
MPTINGRNEMDAYEKLMSSSNYNPNMALEKAIGIIDKQTATIAAMEGMIKELADMVMDRYVIPEWVGMIYTCDPADDPVKLHNMILLALSMRTADKLEVEE